MRFVHTWHPTCAYLYTYILAGSLFTPVIKQVNFRPAVSWHVLANLADFDIIYFVILVDPCVNLKKNLRFLYPSKAGNDLASASVFMGTSFKCIFTLQRLSLIGSN